MVSLSEVVWLHAVAGSIVGVSHIPPEACALSVVGLQVRMLDEVLVLRLAVRIKQALDLFSVRNVASREVGLQVEKGDSRCDGSQPNPRCRSGILPSTSV